MDFLPVTVINGIACYIIINGVFRTLATCPAHLVLGCQEAIWDNNNPLKHSLTVELHHGKTQNNTRPERQCPEM